MTPPASTVDCLRISVTDRCDLRCIYCMPEAQDAAAPENTDLSAYPLSLENIATLVGFLRDRFGLRAVRLTGGEPLTRPDILEWIGRLAETGVEDLALTTNGQRLADAAIPLRKAGLHRVNISLDSLDPQRYARLTRGGRLDRTLAGIEAARTAGFRKVRLNTVVLRGENELEAGDLLEFALARGLEIRFLELMAIGCAAPHHAKWFVASEDVRERLRTRWRLTPLNGAGQGDGRSARPAQSASCPTIQTTFAINDGAGRVGFISPESRPFCAGCRRLRLTADGALLGCLMHRESVLVAQYFTNRPRPDFAALAEAVKAALRSKPVERARHSPRLMAAIGG
ncbi:MAG: radical SAM protein [Candidatus Sumerlaeia bacterium]|nr:radical SAM protein [Candidatus Sumerlaeia bacterium]